MIACALLPSLLEFTLLYGSQCDSFKFQTQRLISHTTQPDERGRKASWQLLCRRFSFSIYFNRIIYECIFVADDVQVYAWRIFLCLRFGGRNIYCSTSSREPVLNSRNFQNHLHFHLGIFFFLLLSFLSSD